MAQKGARFRSLLFKKGLRYQMCDHPNFGCAAWRSLPKRVHDSSYTLFGLQLIILPLRFPLPCQLLRERFFLVAGNRHADRNGRSGEREKGNDHGQRTFAEDEARAVGSAGINEREVIGVRVYSSLRLVRNLFLRCKKFQGVQYIIVS